MNITAHYFKVFMLTLATVLTYNLQIFITQISSSHILNSKLHQIILQLNLHFKLLHTYYIDCLHFYETFFY
jgi:hypothetical protein